MNTRQQKSGALKRALTKERQEREKESLKKNKTLDSFLARKEDTDEAEEPDESSVL